MGAQAPLLAILAPVMFCAACGASTPHAQIIALTDNVAPQDSAEDLATLCVVPSLSRVVVAGSDRLSGEHVGLVKKMRGTLWTLGPVARRLRLQVDLNTLELDHKGVENFVKSPDYLDVAQFPLASFNSLEVEVQAGQDHGQCTGDLTLHGVTRRIRFPFSLAQGKTSAFHTNFLLPRREFGVRRRDMWDFMISPDFRIGLELVVASPDSADAACL